MAISESLFGTLPSGEPVYAYTLKNGSGLSVRILTYGGILANLWAAAPDGTVTDVICGYDTIEGYVSADGYQGALIGRVGNRIAGSRFTLDEKEYTLVPNHGRNSLHGGKNGFNRKVWDSLGQDGEEPVLRLSCTSKDGEEGYPGNLHVEVSYTLTKNAGLSIHYTATTDKPTLINMTNHSYFNLAGYASGSIDHQLLWLDCSDVSSFNDELLPDGRLIPLDSPEGKPYDFTKMRAIGEGFSADVPMMRWYRGYDNNFFFRHYDGQMHHRATLQEPLSGRTMKVYTDLPCMQVYTANMVNAADAPFKSGIKQYPHCGICLETQAMPDSIHFPEGSAEIRKRYGSKENTCYADDVILRPGETYETTTAYVFGEES